MLKVVVCPTTCQAHAILCQEIHSMVMDALVMTGYEVVVWQSEEDFDGAAFLFMLGVGTWGMDEHRFMLEAAGRRGIPRILWQLETLPPPDLPQSIFVKFLLERGPQRSTSLRRFFEKIAYQRLAKQCQDRPWNTDRLFEPRRFSLPFREARKLIAMWQDQLVDEIIVSLGSRQEFLAKHDVPTKFMPFGYHTSIGRPFNGVTRDLDVIFIGSKSPKRAALLQQIEQGLAKHGRSLSIVDKNCYGEERTHLLNRAKILLFLRNYPWEMPRLRMIMAMACKATIVAECSTDTLPFVPGEHFVSAQPSALTDVLLNELENDQARQAIHENAYTFINEKLRLDRLLDEILCQHLAQKHDRTSKTR